MKTIKKDELYGNLRDFLKAKGIEFKNGVYPQRVSRACDLLTDAINETRKTVKQAKGKVDEKLDQLRQSIHKATAPKPPPAPRASRKKAASTRSKPSSSTGRRSQPK
jgi:hypothetical protein